MFVPGKDLYMGPGRHKIMYTLRELREMVESGKYQKCKTCKGKRRLISDTGYGLHEFDCIECLDEDLHPTGLIL